MTVEMGEITGLIGPNGAGKTTTFNACSGLNRPSDGVIRLHGNDVSRLSAGARARRGLGRTFQQVEICDALTVRENVALGREAGLAGSVPTRHLVASRRDRRVTREATRQALELCGLTEKADARAGDLSTGERRLVELARCLAGPFDVLLLDEPSSGLDRAETDRFAELLQSIVATRGCAVLLVEHDVSLVMRVCSRLYVLDFGELLFEGTPAQTAASERVQAAYLGEASTELTAAEDTALETEQKVRA
jgi:ABC-type branched-subunit amino acid transport system ATPase component